MWRNQGAIGKDEGRKASWGKTLWGSWIWGKDAEDKGNPPPLIMTQLLWWCRLFWGERCGAEYAVLRQGKASTSEAVCFIRGKQSCRIFFFSESYTVDYYDTSHTFLQAFKYIYRSFLACANSWLKHGLIGHTWFQRSQKYTRAKRSIFIVFLFNLVCK